MNAVTGLVACPIVKNFVENCFDIRILNADVPDNTLERAAGTVEGQAITWYYCTHVWYNCGWPQ
jgi:hypothetical protein